MGEIGAAQRLTGAERRRVRRGLAKPHPLSTPRTFAPPAVMSSAPTITLGANGAASGITSAVLIPANDPRLRVTGMQLTTRTGGGGTQLYQHVSQVSPSGEGRAQVEFDYYGETFELYCQPQSAHYRVRVNGELATATFDAASTGGAYNHITVAFGSVARRTIRLELLGMYWFGIKIGPTDSVRLPAQPLGAPVVLVGDSFLGNAFVQSYESWGVRLCDLMGWSNHTYVSYGGTGYVNPGTLGNIPLSDRLADISYQSPEVVIVAAGLNDAAYNPGDGVVAHSTVAAEATAFLQSIKALPSNPSVIQIGPWTGSSTSVSAVTSLNTALRSAALTTGNGVDLYIDPVVGQWAKPNGDTSTADGAWLSGSGRVGATTGSGNADLFRGTDGVHPTAAAEEYYASSIAAMINAALPL